MASTGVWKQTEIAQEVPSARTINFTSLIICSLILMSIALLYVWSHVNMTKLEYQLAEEISRREALLEEQKKLKAEVAALKAPQRIEMIARSKLQMRYPERDQVILIEP